MTTFRALVDLSVAKAGDTFETTDEQAAPAVAFGLAEVVEQEASPTEATPEPKPHRSGAMSAKRTTHKASS